MRKENVPFTSCYLSRGKADRSCRTCFRAKDLGSENPLNQIGLLLIYVGNSADDGLNLQPSPSFQTSQSVILGRNIKFIFWGIDG